MLQTMNIGIASMFVDIPNMIKDWINEELNNFIDILIDMISNLVFNYDGLAGTALTAHTLFVGFSATLLVVVALSQVIKMLLSEADGSREANVAGLLVNTVKSGIFLVIAPLIVSTTMQVCKIFTDFFFGDIGRTLKDGVTDVTENNFTGVFSNDGAWTFLLSLFILVVLAFFIFKVAVEQVQLFFNELISPIVAVSIVSEDHDMLSSWSKDLISHALTIITLVLSIALFTEALFNRNDLDTWSQITMILGTGALVISGPTIIKSIRYSSGSARVAQSAGRMVASRLLRSR